MKVNNDRQEKILDFQDLLEALEMNIKFPAQNVEKLQESRQRTQDKLWEIICSRKYQHSTSTTSGHDPSLLYCFWETQ